MTRNMLWSITVALFVVAVTTAPSDARSRVIICNQLGCSDQPGHQLAKKNSNQSDAYSERRHSSSARIPRADPRPGRWCMWWLRRHLGIPRSAFRPYEWNLARAGRYLGTPAHGPAIGAIVVWRHHVGIITGKSAGRWVIKSGNDSGRVRERPRSLHGAIAFRWPPGFAMAGL